MDQGGSMTILYWSGAAERGGFGQKLYNNPAIHKKTFLLLIIIEVLSINNSGRLNEFC